MGVVLLDGKLHLLAEYPDGLVLGKYLAILDDRLVHADLTTDGHSTEVGVSLIKHQLVEFLAFIIVIRAAYCKSVHSFPAHSYCVLKLNKKRAGLPALCVGC